MKALNLNELTFGKDGNQFFYLYGENLQEGISGFGDTPAQAANDFVLNSDYTIPEVNGKCKVLYEGRELVATVKSIEGETYTVDHDGITMSNLTIWKPY